MTQTITVDDDIDPTASNPAPLLFSVSVMCRHQDIAVVTDEADNCSVPVVAFVSDVMIMVHVLRSSQELIV